MRCKKLALLALGIASAACANAVSVAFQIIQHDPSDSGIRSSSYVIEENLFGFFFDKGIIVSNSPAAVSDGDDSAVFKKSLEEAREGDVDFFIEITGDYDSSHSANPEAALLENIRSVSWRIIDVDSGAAVHSGRKSPPAASGVKNRRKGLADFAVGIAEDIYTFIRR